MAYSDSQSDNPNVLDQRTSIIVGELLPTILANLNKSYLLKLRLVARAWEKEATQLLTKRKDLKIKFIFCRHTDPPTFNLWCRLGRCHPPDNLQGRGETIADFLKLLKSRIQNQEAKSPFFVSRFEFNYCRGGILELPPVLDFFRTYGVHIKELQLQSFPDYPSGWNSRSILKHAPNLEIFKVCVMDYYHIPRLESSLRPIEPTAEETALIFQSLKVFEITTCKPFNPQGSGLQNLTQLLSQADCLQSISVSVLSLDSTFISALCKVGKLHLLKFHKLKVDLVELLASCFDPEELKNLEKLNRAATESIGHQLKEVKLKGFEADFRVISYELWRRALAALTKFLEMNSESLESLQLKNMAVHLWNGLKLGAIFPKLPNVTSMRVSYDDETATNKKDPLKFLPRGVFDNFPSPSLSPEDLSTIFPSLTTIKIKHWPDEHHPNLLPFWNHVLPSVKIFRMAHRQMNFNRILPQLSVMFPRLDDLDLKKLTTSEIEDPEDFVEGLLKLEYLAILRLRVKVQNAGTLENELFPLCAALLGLNLEELLEVYDNWKTSGQWTVPKEESPYYSNPTPIYDLKYFRGLSLRLQRITLSDHNCRVCMFLLGLMGQLSLDKKNELEAEIVTADGLRAGASPKTAQDIFEEFSWPLSCQFSRVSLRLSYPCDIQDLIEYVNI